MIRPGGFQWRDDPLTTIGALSVKAQTAPESVDSVAWRLGYQNALSDLIRLVCPHAGGARRRTLNELKAEDERRGNQP